MNKNPYVHEVVFENRRYFFDDIEEAKTFARANLPSRSQSFRMPQTPAGLAALLNTVASGLVVHTAGQEQHR
jgi:hypothetical protein